MRYAAPTTIKEAAGLMAKAKGSAYVLAGGTDLLVRLKSGLIEPSLVVDIKRIASMQSVTKTAAGFRIGAGVPAAALGENAALKKAWPGVVEAANLIGSDQIQSRCTIVGNLCNASPAADSVPAMIAAGAKAMRRRTQRQAHRRGRGRRDRSGQDIVEKRRGHRSDHAAEAGAENGRCVSALHSAHRDGHRGRQRRRVSDAWTQGRRQTGARRARCRRGHRRAGTRGGTGDHRHASSTMPRSSNSRPRVQLRASRSTTNAARSNSEPRSPACSRAGPLELPISAQGESDVRRYPRSDHDQR